MYGFILDVCLGLFKIVEPYICVANIFIILFRILGI